LFFDPAYADDDAYVVRRYQSSIAPGAWEALAAARFRRPGLDAPPLPSSKRAYERITVPTLVVEGAGDKLLANGWAAEIAAQIPDGRSAVIADAGHCPQIEQPDAVNELLLEFLGCATRERTAS
jgi:pimeloyl-ACP methyl ester carboxylesterase